MRQSRALLDRQRKLEKLVADATARLRHEATHDHLTELLNRTEVERRLAADLDGKYFDEELLIALLDIDHFKAVNDRYGHLAGDDVLRQLGKLVTASLRDGEYAGRYGGEEILIVLKDQDGYAVERVLDLHLNVGNETVISAETTIDVTCSVGLAWARADDNWETLIGRADEALYEAKRAGRNRVTESRRLPRLPERHGAVRPEAQDGPVAVADTQNSPSYRDAGTRRFRRRGDRGAPSRQ